MFNWMRLSEESQLLLFNRESTRKTGVIVVLRELTGAIKRSRKTSMREPSNSKDSCLPKDKRMTIYQFILMSGVIMKPREESMGHHLRMYSMYLHTAMSGIYHTLLLRRKTGVTKASTPMNGATKRLREESLRKLLMINHSMRDQLRQNGKLMELAHQCTTGRSHTLLLRRETGATPESRVPTGVIKRSLRILTREPRDNKDSCSCKSKRKTGVTEASTPMNGVTRRLREENLLRLLMINLFTRDQPRLNGKSPLLNTTTFQAQWYRGKTGATVESRAPTGVPKRRKRT